MGISSKASGLAVAAVVATPGCGYTWTAYEAQCKAPFIYSLTATPEEAYTSDSVTIIASLKNMCASVPVLTFLDYNTSVISPLPGYTSEINGLDGVDGIVLQQTDDEGFMYATEALPLDSFAPGYLRYSLTVYGGFAFLDVDRKDTLNNYISLRSDAGE